MKDYAAQNDSRLLTHRLHEEHDQGINLFKREPFQRDRDRIIHSRAFRRMMHKTQVFNANKGDHYRNRLTHTLEVSQIARSIGKNLDLNDELIEAIALGHDLGHTPFGHVGERTLNEILMDDSKGVLDKKLGENFKHNFQSLRVVDLLETRCNDYLGINLTLATREGILKHTKILDGNHKLYNYPGLNLENISTDKPSMTLEGQVVGMADEIAQYTHDLEDGVRSGVINFAELLDQPLVKECAKIYNIKINAQTSSPAYETRSMVIKNLVGFLIYDACKTSLPRIDTFWKSLDNVDKESGKAFERERCIVFSESVNNNVLKLKKVDG